MIVPIVTRAARLWLALLATALLALSVPAAAQENGAETAWRLLDYVAVDYSGAVSGGKIISASEYAEMREFAASIDERLKALPAKPQKAALLAGSAKLQSAIAQKQSPEQVATIARGLGSALLDSYPVPLGPRKAPDLKLGAKLYAETCASCHGMTGKADTAMAKQLEPPPVDFADRARADKRSPFALYQVVDQGLEGTAMASYASLPSEQKWALAFYASRFAYPNSLEAAGKQIWEGDPQLRSRISNLDDLAGLTQAALAKQIGDDKASAVLAYLRAHPDAVTSTGASALTVARQKLQQSLSAYEAGDRDKAKDLALAAYLDGFEPVEGILTARDGSIVSRVETAMGELRSAIAAGKPAADVRARVNSLNALFDEAEQALAPDQATSASTFLGAFTILFREGLEALLIVVGMLAFLRKGDRPEMIRPVHAGWISALIAGGLTWVAATTLISISGASRELTEGFGSILAAAVLLFVGIWMHGKSQADEWHRYIKEKVGHALSRKSAWFLFFLAFIAVTSAARTAGAVQRNFAQGALGKYLPAQMAKEIIDHPELLALHGEKKNIYVLFSDLEGFTKMSHALQPEMVAKLLNRYLDMLSQVVLDHGGVIDKFVGDAVVAFWGAPIARPDDAKAAAKVERLSAIAAVTM